MVKCKDRVKTLGDSISEMTEHKYYIEVKTHTQGSRKLNQFQISRGRKISIPVLVEDKFLNKKTGSVTK